MKRERHMISHKQQSNAQTRLSSSLSDKSKSSLSQLSLNIHPRQWLLNEMTFVPVAEVCKAAQTTDTSNKANTEVSCNQKTSREIAQLLWPVAWLRTISRSTTLHSNVNNVTMLLTVKTHTSCVSVHIVIYSMHICTLPTTDDLQSVLYLNASCIKKMEQQSSK